MMETTCYEAAQVPLGLLANIAGLLDDALTVFDKVGDHLISDLGIVAHLGVAAAESCRYTILINLKSIRDEARKKHCHDGIALYRERIKRTSSQIIAQTEARLT